MELYKSNELDMSGPDGQLLHALTQIPACRDGLVAGDMPRPARDHLIGEIHEHIDGMSFDEKYGFYTKSLHYLADEGASTQDGRDSLMTVFGYATESLAATLYGRPDAREKLTTPLYQALDSIDQDTDVLGGFASIMQAAVEVADAVQVAATVPQRNDIIRAVDDRTRDFVSRQSPDEREFATTLLDEFERTIRWGGAVQSEEQAIQHARAMPDMSAAERTLHDNYLEVVKRDGTFKSDLWERTPILRGLCEAKGVSLERFWNKHNPDTITQDLEVVRTQQPDLHALLLERVVEKYPKAVDDRNRLLPIYSDQAFMVAKKLHGELLADQVSSSDALERLRHLSEREWRDPRAQRRFEQQLVKLVEKAGVRVDETDTDWEAVRLYIETRNQQKLEAATTLDAAFRFDQDDTRFDIRGREASDMYLSDITGDCTAYHLTIGFNGNIVPVWLTMPNFVLATINDDFGDMIAKVGLLLGVRDDKPCLVIDSVESSRLVDRSREVVVSMNIDEGLTAIMDWAKGIGLDTTYGHSFNNSSELMDQITARSRSAGSANRFEVLGGEQGLHEYSESLLGKAGNRVLGRYFQTITNGDTALVEIEEEGSHTLRRFERTLQTYLDSEDGRCMQEGFMQNDWEAMVEAYMRHNTGFVLNVLNVRDSDDLQKIWKHVSRDEVVLGESDGGVATPRNLIDEIANTLMTAFGQDFGELEALEEEERRYLDLADSGDWDEANFEDEDDNITYYGFHSASDLFCQQLGLLRTLYECEKNLAAIDLTPRAALIRLRGDQHQAPVEARDDDEGRLYIDRKLPEIVSHNASI